MADLGYENSTGFTVIETLQNNDWLDRRTRAIILEFSSFNPSVSLLCIATYFFEVEASEYSTPFTRTSTEVISLDSTGAGSQQFHLICILFFIIFVALYLGRKCYGLYKQRSRYFKSLWGWVEIFQVLFSFLAVVMYIVRSKKATSTIQKLQKNIYANLSFQEVIISLEIENAALGILTFIVTAKLLRLIRFNQHVVVFSKTLKTSARLLSSFTVVLDENLSQKEGENKRIFDAISESIKITKGNEEIVKMTKTEIRNCGENPNKKRMVNFDAISKAIIYSIKRRKRGKFNREKA